MNDKTISRTPSPECPSRHEDHAEHVFTYFGFMNMMVGARIDCPGKGV